MVGGLTFVVYVVLHYKSILYYKQETLQQLTEPITLRKETNDSVARQDTGLRIQAFCLCVSNKSVRVYSLPIL